MNKRIMLLTLTILLTCSVIFSCDGGSGGGNNPQNDARGAEENDESPDTETIPAEEIKYIYPDIDGNGADFTFLSPSTTWGYYTDVVRDEISGEVLDDAIYNRNRFIEQQFNIELKAVERDIGEINGALRRVITSGDDIYEAAFIPAFFGGNVGALINANMLCNLYDIATMDFEREWYNQTMLKEAAMGKGRQVYYAGCDINVMTVQSIVFIYFNQDMMSNLGIELPYNAVREGKWTYDMFYEYMARGANLNGAESFKWDPSGPANYGFVAHDNCAVALFEGSCERFINTDSDNMPQLAIEGERFLNVLLKLEDMLVNSPDGYFMFANDNPATGFHFEPIFRNGRALMITGELKAADVFRDMETTFGIAPIPTGMQSPSLIIFAICPPICLSVSADGTSCSSGR